MKEVKDLEVVSESTNTIEDKRVEINVIPNGQYVKSKTFVSHKNPYELSITGNKDKPFFSLFYL